MYVILQKLEKMLMFEFVRYSLNGLVATVIHFSALYINLHILGIKSAGIANGIAATFGVTVSFIGSRYFVFKAHQYAFFQEVLKFGGVVVQKLTGTWTKALDAGW